MDDQEFMRQFEDCSFPFEQWNHRAHVKLAFLYLRSHPFEAALSKLRAGIQAYNAANGVPEGPFTGYNETTTQALLHIVKATMAAYGDLYPTESADAFCDAHPQLQSRHVLRLFYTPERRAHPEAKTRLIAPDLTALPRIRGIESDSR
jgi:hypothetical protein